MRERLAKWKASWDELRRFVSQDIWLLGAPGEVVPKGFVVKQIRVLILLGTKLLDGTHMLRASSLTFATILTLVPFLVIMFTVIQFFDLEASLSKPLADMLQKSAEAVSFKKPPADPANEVDPDVSEGEASNDAANDATATSSVESDDAATVSPSGEEITQDAETDEPSETSAQATTGDTDESVEALPSQSDEEPESELLALFITTVFRGVSESDPELENPVDTIVALVNRIAKPSAASNSAVIGFSAVVLVFSTVFGLMRNLELSFNRIWGIRKSRPLVRRMADYLVITLLLPFAVATVFGVMTALQSQAFRDLLGPLAYGLRGTQYLVIIVLFALLYKIVPNTTVRWRYAFLAGLVAGTGWVLLSWGYVNFQFGLARQREVLGHFAQFPLFLMWIYLSWAVLLLGAELAFAYQNEETFALERHADEASAAYREALGLRAMVAVARRFTDGEPALVRETAAREWNVPPSLLGEALDTLKESGYVIECASEPVAYQPARPLNRIAATEVLEALHRSGSDPSALQGDAVVQRTLESIRQDGSVSMEKLLTKLPELDATLDSDTDVDTDTEHHA